MQDKISYTLKKSRRAKKMRLTVYCNGSVVVTAPFGAEYSIIERFITEKKKWLLDKIQFFKDNGGNNIRKFSRKDYLENKSAVLALVKERIEFYNKIYNFLFKKVFIKNQKTRWGSCSRKGNINLNYKILFLPKDQQDYIIVHEMCHLREFNHSRRFWALVAKTIPNYLNIRKKIRRNALL